MGRYLTDEQIERVREELSIAYSLPYIRDLPGVAWEQILTVTKGGIWTQKRDNRPRPDFYTEEGGQRVNYSVKTEALRLMVARGRAASFLGHHEDFIVARPNVESLLRQGESIATLNANMLGAKVLQYYRQEIVVRYEWHVIAFLLRLNVEPREFIYWEERPPATYNPGDYWWRDSERSTPGNRNILGFPLTVDPSLSPLRSAKFKWTSGGKQFYIRYTIPSDADVWTIDTMDLGVTELLDALREKLRGKKRIRGQDSAT